MLAVGVVAVNGSPFVSPSGDMITSAGSFDAQWSSHDPVFARAKLKSQGHSCQLLRCDPFAPLHFLPRDTAGYWGHFAFSGDSRLLAVAISRSTVRLVE